MIKTLLVDDEFLALNLLENFVAQVPDLELVDKLRSPMKALETLRAEPIDLLFLDIQMPKLSGNHLLKALPHPPVTIFTTAYSEYATEAFDLNAADYLLKPFSFERFLQAIHKGKEQLSLRQAAPMVTKGMTETQPEPSYITVKVDGRIQKIFLQDILFVEGWKEYVRINCRNGRHTVLDRMKNMEEQLPNQFLRVHKSFIVATQQVEALEGNQLVIGDHKIPISRTKKEEVVRQIFGANL